MTPRTAALAIVALFAIGAACAGEPAFVALDVPTATVDPVASTPTVTTSLAEVDVADGPVAVGTQPAVRGDRIVVAVGPPPTVPPRPGLNGMPFAPAHLEGCDRMEWYADQAGLPHDFGWIGWEESRCRNDVNTWCCWGFFQIHQLHVGAGSADECDVDEVADMFGANDLARQRNACMAGRVLRQQGVCAWDVVRC